MIKKLFLALNLSLVKKNFICLSEKSGSNQPVCVIYDRRLQRRSINRPADKPSGFHGKRVLNR